ncbi:hypothetical protein VZ94_15985 [Methylocucumis oryzae]|uniref:Uncharacterized protein n=1 Tax=Methylocucumis oryzae TaxID=1632867 RepID=A0A0F3IGB2_9GAMM|nr:hypothetical protein VZ94_15985 [Methylocucumis oryzae]
MFKRLNSYAKTATTTEDHPMTLQPQSESYGIANNDAIYMTFALVPLRNITIISIKNKSLFYNCARMRKNLLIDAAFVPQPTC